MATDKLIYEYATHFTKAFAKFIGIEDGDYEAKSIALKQTEKRADLFLINQAGTRVVLVETQGYEDDYLYHRMVATKMPYCLQFKYTHKMEAAAIFLEESYYRAAESFHRQFDDLKFSPKTIVLSRLKVDDLSRLDDVHLIPLFPLCDIMPSALEQQAPLWAEQIKTKSELAPEEKGNLLVLLGGFLSHRLRSLSKDDISKMLGGFAMQEVPLFQEIEREGMQRVLLKQLSARFGNVPEDIRQKIKAITKDEDLDRIATALLTIQSVDELKNLVN